jgi:hypothetical protein
MVTQHNAILTEIEKAAREALRDAAKAVLKRAKELAPKDEGDLRRAGRVSVNDVDIRVVFRAPHAWLQHERLDYKHPAGGGPKYLERAVDELGVEADILSGIKARLR